MRVLLLAIAGFAANSICAYHALADARVDYLPDRGESTTPVSDAPQGESESPHRTGAAVAPHLGLGTPYGVAGVALDARILPWLAIEAGVGLGPNYGAMPRFRLPINEGALTLGSGISMGPYSAEPILSISFCPGCDDDGGEWGWSTWENAIWSKTEIGVEVPLSNVILLRVYGGYREILNKGGAQCPSYSGYTMCQGGRDGMPYAGVSWGIRLW
jgi:hypothetical protein